MVYICPHEVKFDTIFDVPHVVKFGPSLKFRGKMEVPKSHSKFRSAGISKRHMNTQQRENTSKRHENTPKGKHIYMCVCTIGISKDCTFTDRMHLSSAPWTFQCL